MADLGFIDILNTSYVMKAAETTLNQYCVAVLDTATKKQVTRPAGANAGKIAGVLRDKTHAAGTEALYQVGGFAKVKIASAVSIGDVLVVADTSGRVAAKGTGAHASGTGIVGIAQEAATSANSIITCLLRIGDEFSS